MRQQRIPPMSFKYTYDKTTDQNKTTNKEKSLECFLGISRSDLSHIQKLSVTVSYDASGIDSATSLKRHFNIDTKATIGDGKSEALTRSESTTGLLNLRRVDVVTLNSLGFIFSIADGSSSNDLISAQNSIPVEFETSVFLYDQKKSKLTGLKSRVDGGTFYHPVLTNSTSLTYYGSTAKIEGHGEFRTQFQQGLALAKSEVETFFAEINKLTKLTTKSGCTTNCFADRNHRHLSTTAKFEH